MRIVPSNLALFSGPAYTGDGGSSYPIREIYGVREMDFNSPLDIIETDIYGKAEKLLEYPGFTEQKVSFSYYCDGFSNEASIGLVTGTATGAFFNINRNQERNLYLFVAPRGSEARGLNGSDGRLIAMGNGFLTSYSVAAAIGSYPVASAGFDFLNSEGHADAVSFRNPSIVSGSQHTGVLTIGGVSGSAGRPAIIRPGDIHISINSGIFQSADSLIQGFKLDFDIPKENVPVAGQRYPRRICPGPPKISLSIDILSTHDFLTGDVFSYLCQTGTNYITITFRQKCTAMYDFVSQYQLRDMFYNGESFSSPNAGSQVTTMSWQSQTGALLGAAEYYYMTSGGEFYVDPEGNYYTHIE